MMKITFLIIFISSIIFSPLYAQTIEEYYQQKIQMVIEKSKAMESGLKAEYELKLITQRNDFDLKINSMNEKITAFGAELSALKDSLNQKDEQIKDLRARLNLAPPLPDVSSQSVQIEKGVPHPEKLNLNSASFDKLVEINHLNESTANYIIWYRENIEKFKNLNDLNLVPGINKNIYEKIKENFYVD